MLAEAGHEVVLWARTPEVARAINEEHRNPRYLSDYRLPSAIRATADYACACEGAEAVVIVTPSAALRSVAADLRELIAPGTPIVICSKGVEEKTGLLPIDTFAAELGNAGRMAVLSGPTHAEEVICRKPSAAVVASADRGDGALLPRPVRHAVLPHLHLRRPGRGGAVRRLQERHRHCRGHLLRHGLRRQHRGPCSSPAGSPR